MATRFLVFVVLLLAAGCGRGTPPVASAILPVKKKWVARLPLGEELAGGALVTDGSRVFVSTRRQVLALDRVLGTALWTAAGVSGRLSAAPGVLLARAGNGTVTALEPSTGRTRWSVETGSAGDIDLVIDGARVYVAGSRYTVLDTASGKVVTDLALESPAVTRPVATGAWLFVGFADRTLRCLDVASGATIWSFAMKTPLETPPALDGDRILVGTGTSDRRALALEMKGKTDWTFDLGAGVAVSPAAAGRHVLFATSEAVLYAFVRGNGHMAWRAALPSRPLGPPIVVGRQVLVACLPDELLAFDTTTGKAAGSTRAGLEHLGSDARPSEIRTPLLVHDGLIFAGMRSPRDPWAVVALEPGAAPKAPEPPAPFAADPADEVVKPSPIP